jgi:hypothetical protein
MADRASAAYEQARTGTQPATFGTSAQFPEQLFEVTGMATNHTGAGGVGAGSFYVVSRRATVMRFSPGKEGEEPQLEEEWGWGISEEDLNAYVRCGAAYQGVANPVEHTYEECFTNVDQGEHPGQFGLPMSIAVDQATGDVYVRNDDRTGHREHHMVEVFTAKGELVGEGFGESAGTSESIAESPSKLHFSREGGIAVDDSGNVYLIDEDLEAPSPQSRVATFAPCTPADYENYCYSAGKDLSLPNSDWWRISLIGNDQLVIASDDLMQEYSIGSGTHSLLCTQQVTGQLYAMTANEMTAEVFWFRESDHSIRRLAACAETGGPWQELQTIAPKPVIPQMYALTVNPVKVWGANRPAGVLYGVESNQLPATGYIFVPAAEGVFPLIEGQEASNTAATSTTLTATIDPRGSTVSYHFEYLSEADFRANGSSFEGPIAPSREPLTNANLSSGSPATVAAVISGLSPETSYRFRVVAESECDGPGHAPCQIVGAPAAFTTLGSGGGLPDGRRYELVSPAQKHGGEALPAFSLISSCPTECKPPGALGTRAFPMQSAPDGDAVTYMGYPFSSTEGAAVFNSYLSARSAGGWATTAMSPALLAGKEGAHIAYSTDLREDIIEQGLPTLSSEAPPGIRNFYLQNAADPRVLTPLVTTTPSRPLRQWAISYGGHSADFAAQFFAANEVLTGGTSYAPPPPAPSLNETDLYEWRDGSLALVNVLPGNVGVASGASFASVSPDAYGVAANGRRVFWRAGGSVYVREDGQITRELAHQGTFVSASADGLSVMFSDGCLYSLLTETCTDLTQGHGGFLGVAGQSTDLSTVYFVDTSALPGRSTLGEEATRGQPNLYIYEAGVGTRFIATLAPTDGVTGSIVNLNDWDPIAALRTAEASPNGRYLAFASTRDLTGRNSVGPCSVNALGKLVSAPCREVFLYEAQEGRLVCASCSPTGEAPRGNSTMRRIQGTTEAMPQPRYLTDQGRLFFDSQDRLSPLDVNGKVEDVYESEPDWVGSCDRDRCVSLISGGTESLDSNFLAMGGEGEEEGNDVFFTTRGRLVPTDTDELIDVYDARVGGGFSSDAEKQPAECVGEACQSAPLAPPALTPSSQSFSGAGNLPTTKCPKGKVKKNGECERQKHAPKKKAKKKRAAGRRRAAGHRKGGSK